MKANEAAAYLGISISTLRRWCDAGHLPYWKTVGGQRRFEEDQLQAWLDQRRKEGSNV